MSNRVFSGYFRNPLRELDSDMRRAFLFERWRHNRRYLRVAAILIILITVVLGLRRLFLPTPDTSVELNFRFLVDFAFLAGVSILYLIASFIVPGAGGDGSVAGRSAAQWAYIIACTAGFSYLFYLDLQISLDLSALLGFILFFSVAIWMNFVSLCLVLFAADGMIAFLYFQGVHPSVVGNELLVLSFIFNLVGLGMFLAINDVRTRSFLSEKRLGATISELKEMSLRDPLTLLFNRRMMNEELDREMALARRTGKPLTLILLDLDHFKRINDSLGHSTGDAVLRECAGRLLESVRESDGVYRFGGEEFVVMLPDTPLDKAVVLARRLLAAFAEVAFEDVPWPVTVSMGLADSTERLIPADLIKLADCRMYAAKDAGRNRYEAEGCDGGPNGGLPEIP